MESSKRSVDINLTDLISSVERDIWLLEQLESNSRRNVPPGELPFPMTREVLQLPGFKPRNRSTHLPSKQVKNDTGKPLTPVLPPKHRGVTPDLPDTLHQRLMPKDNCVTNILYTRRLPSPPVYRRSFQSTADDFTSDDHFRERVVGPDADESNQLFCPLCAQKFGYSFGLECHLLSVHRQDLKTFSDHQTPEFEKCPRCRAQFIRQGILVKHLIDAHKDFVIKSILLPNGDSTLKRYLECRFCGQHFMRRHLKLFIIHVEQRHESELERFLDKNPSVTLTVDLGQSENSTEVALTLSLLRTVSFPENSNSVITPEPTNARKATKPQNGTQTLASSFRKKRSSSQPAARTLPRMNTAKQSLEADLQYLPADFQGKDSGTLRNSFRTKKKKNKNQENVLQYAELKFESPAQLATPPQSAKNKLAKQLQLRMQLPSYRHVPQPEPPPDQQLHDLLGLGKSSANSLDDDVMTGSSCYASSSESCHSNSVDTDPSWTNVIRMTSQESNLYKCNLCEESFEENAFLLTHLKNKHRSNVSKALRPQFSCGACPAKFFKNSFLVKHCEFHLNSKQHGR